MIKTFVFCECVNRGSRTVQYNFGWPFRKSKTLHFMPFSWEWQMPKKWCEIPTVSTLPLFIANQDFIMVANNFPIAPWIYTQAIKKRKCVKQHSIMNQGSPNFILPCIHIHLTSNPHSKMILNYESVFQVALEAQFWRSYYPVYSTSNWTTVLYPLSSS